MHIPSRHVTRILPHYTQGRVSVIDEDSGGVGVWQYYVKIVPTVFHPASSREPAIKSNQFTVHDSMKILGRRGHGMIAGLPGAFFIYDFSPFEISISESPTSFVDFLTSVFGIVGGAMAVCTFIFTFGSHAQSWVVKMSVRERRLM